MKKELFLDKYPIYTLNIKKEDSSFKDLDTFCNNLKQKIDKHPVAKLIGIFDHFKHTQAQKENEISPQIIAAKIISFCFGKKLTEPKMLALRPRNIGLVETKNSLIISFLEAPNPQFTKTITEWVTNIN